MDNNLKLLNILINHNSIKKETILYNIQKHALILIKLNQEIKKILPIKLHPWYRVMNFRQNILILETVNASWMMRLYYEKPILFLKLKKKFYHHYYQ